MNTLRLLSYLTLLLLLLPGCEEETASLPVVSPDWQPTDYQPHPFFTYHLPDYITDSLPRAQSSHWSFLGELDSAETYFQREGGHPVVPVPEDAELLPARPAILERAGAAEITLINEAHHLPYHRSFTASLLQGFYDLGYRHLGLEALMPFPLFDSLANAPDPQIIVGFYGREPEFGHLLREARRVGFTVFGYDQPGKGTQPLREIGGARHIMDYRRRNPAGKLLIHCGYAHAREGHYDYFAGGPLAQRLADSLGTDPLTISQTSFVPSGVEEISIVAPPYAPTADTSSRFDLYVAHPAVTYGSGRPDYKFTGGREPLRIEIDPERVGEGPFLLFAFPRGADINLSIPFDVVVVSGGGEVTLGVPADVAVELLLYGRDGISFRNRVSRTASPRP